MNTEHWFQANMFRTKKSARWKTMRDLQLGIMHYKVKNGEYFETELLIDSGASSSTVPMDANICEFLSGYEKQAVDDAHRFVCANGG